LVLLEDEATPYFMPMATSESPFSLSQENLSPRIADIM
jgi:hypothetical protein